MFEGAHAVMLTYETAIGRYPLQAMRVLSDICREAERSIDYRTEYIELRKDVRPPVLVTSSVASTVALIAYDVQAKLVVLIAPSPALSLEIAAYRQAHVVHVTDNAVEARAAMLLRGRSIWLVKRGAVDSVDIDALLFALRDAGLAEPGSVAIVVKKDDKEIMLYSVKN